MDNQWICLMVSSTLPHKDNKLITKELSVIFGSDLVDHRVVCDTGMLASGEYYLFVRCANYRDHLDTLNKHTFVTNVVPSRESPHYFSDKEVKEFAVSVGRKVTPTSDFNKGDVVLVRDGYLRGLYGVVQGQSGKKCRVFFSFYVRRFTENLRVTLLEFIGNVSKYEFPVAVDGCHLAGVRIVHHRKLHRKTGRKHKAGERRGRRRTAVLHH